jgi:outer membrane receptor for ferrienterochelin and colicin
LLAQRSTHATVGIERRIGERVRFKAELYDREDRQVPFSAQTEWRLVNGLAAGPVYGPVLANSVRGYSRGVEFSLQRVSANRLSGWLSYSYGQARYRDAASGLSFDGDYDQRHTISAFASYRVTRTVNLSSKFHYESNFPVVGFFQGHLGQNDASDPEVVTLSSQRNQLRVPAYSRLDFRLNKVYNYKRSRITLYGEIDNLLDHANWRFFGLGQFNFSTGQAWLIRDKMFPILPFAGLTVEF